MKILIVDDSLFAQQYCKRAIAERYPEAEFTFASSGKIGYDRYITNRPDIVITDLLMPDVTGQQMIKMIREADPDSKIIVVSSDIQTTVKQEIAQFGVIGFINKPLNNANCSRLLDIIGGHASC